MLIFLFSISNIVLLRVRRSGTAALLNGVKKRKSLFNFSGIFWGIARFEYLDAISTITAEPRLRNTRTSLSAKRKVDVLCSLNTNKNKYDNYKKYKRKTKNIRGNVFFLQDTIARLVSSLFQEMFGAEASSSWTALTQWCNTKHDHQT